MKLTKKVSPQNPVFYLMFLLVLSGTYSCTEKDSSSEVELTSSVNDEVGQELEELKEIDAIDIAAKLASGESFLLPSISGCNYDDVSEAFGVLVEAPSIRQQNQISEILRFSGLPSNFRILKTTNEIDNAFAAILQDQRLIVFDEKLLIDTEQGSDAYWSSMSILAHEVGHHLSGHTVDGKGSNHKTEMEADKFSGFVLFKMGASLDEANYAMNLIGSDTDSRSHPSKVKRLGYIEEGWNEAQRQRAFASLPPPPYDDNDEFREYPPDHLLDFDTYNDLYIDGGRSYGLIKGVEGIIIKSVDNKNSFHFDILLTALTEEHEHLEVGEIFTFGMDNPVWAFRALHKFERDTFTKGVMVPGRKIKITLNTEGNQGNYSITRVKVVPRELEQ
ncbi:M48 family metalloprotease [Algoriphagus aquimarinus]|uniref:M48 family metalloprotease n=1 Tax=Algoriphagus aquimarinus TaxID=237018 RepID=UPI0030D95B45|tara:strand:- start:2450 stop:3616 length:1167 start_codon:yes stop_codon:yes gene_type:complete